MHKRKASTKRFERMNAQREKAVLWLRREMINAAWAAGQSGFAVQIRMGSRFSDAATGTVGLREARPRAR
jgi:hypothetical protein